MRFTTLKTVGFVATVLLGAGTCGAQQQINLSAGPTSITLPDGSTVPMWGYTCGAAVTGSTATCAALNQAAAPAATATTPAGWSPVVITVPTGQSLTVNLTNKLSFTTAGTGVANTVPTSLTIVGQLGGGLGTVRTTTPSPTHATQSVTWPTANSGPTNVPPPQGPRVQSFATEVAAGATAALTWSALQPGTYLIESGTHPSIQGPMGLYGILVVTQVPTAATATTAAAPGTAYPAVTYTAEVPLLLSEIDPVQNNAVNAAVSHAGFSETEVWSGQPTGCGNPASTSYQTCYPPAVNYTPLYFLFNGVAFSKTSASTSVFAATPGSATAPVTGSILVRLVNAGLRMHVPAIVGSQTSYQGIASTAPAVSSGFSLIAEDGNVVPGVPRVQSEVFMAAGKTYDVMVNAPPAGTTSLPVFDRALGLADNGIGGDAGMLAFISINGAGLPADGALAPAVARADNYSSLAPCAATPCPALVVSDPAKGVVANDTNVYGVELLTAPTHGTVALNANGTFSYTPTAAGTTPDSFVYCANGAVTAAGCASGVTATVTLGAAQVEAATGITVSNISYTSKVATYLRIPPPGILSVDKDAAGYPLSVALSSITQPAGVTLAMDSNGGFLATIPASSTASTYSFTYRAQNSQGTLSTNAATVVLNFPSPSNLAVTVKDPKTSAILTDYRWIIEEDRSFYIDPTNTANTGTNIVPILGVNFHTSDMPYVAQGCTGPVSCEGGQTTIDPSTGLHALAVCDIGNGACRPDTTGNGKTSVLPSAVSLDPTKRYYLSILPGDAANAFTAGNISACPVTLGATPSTCGHSMSGAPIPAPCAPGTTCTAFFAPVTVWV